MCLKLKEDYIIAYLRNECLVARRVASLQVGMTLKLDASVVDFGIFFFFMTVHCWVGRVPSIGALADVIQGPSESPLSC